jgi:PEP-CTERM motif
MSKSPSAAAFLYLLLATVAVTQADDLVVPQSNTSTEAPSNNDYPFGTLGSINLHSMRYQQVYGAAVFAPIASPIQVTQLAFRPDAVFGAAFSNTLTAQIDLSTTQSGPDNLNSTFALNVGPDDVTVFPEGPLTLSSAFIGPSGGPKNFDIMVSLTTPFIYSPANGNLLLDVRVFDGASSTFFDATDDLPDTSDGMSRQWSVDGVNSTVTTFHDSQGLVTKFTFTPVPEPSTPALLGLGGASLIAVGRRAARR